MKKNARFYFFANWKMYLDVEESGALAKAVAEEGKKIPVRVTAAIFPTALALLEVVKKLAGTTLAVGAQNVYWIEKGGYTGEISASMCKSIGCSYALVGHSERRHLFHESNHEVRNKIETLLGARLTPVLCVGETLVERKDDRTEEVLETQMRAAFTDIAWPKDMPVFIAYEPVWSVGTGEACDPAEADRIGAIIKSWVKELLRGNRETIVLYGGSVRADSIKRYFEQRAIDGVLVGQASTKLDTWLELTRGISL